MPGGNWGSAPSLASTIRAAWPISQSPSRYGASPARRWGSCLTEAVMTGTDNTDQTPPPAPEETQVEIHKPKPVHNWREFLTEIGVVVIGVCIALAAE